MRSSAVQKRLDAENSQENAQSNCRMIEQHAMTPQEEIDRVLKEEDIPLTKEILALNRKMRAETAVRRNELREMYREFQSEMDALLAKRQTIRQKVLALWEKHFPKKVTLNLPAAMVSRRNKVQLTVRNTTALLNALAAVKRLDLVSYVFNEREVARLHERGKLRELPEKAITITNNYNLQVRPKKKRYLTELEDE